MDADEPEQLDLDFESMLDAVLGIDPLPAAQQSDLKHAGAMLSSNWQAPRHPMIVGSPVAYDQLSPSCSTTASPVHYYHPSPCSPCISSSSNQIHAPVAGYSSSFTDSAGMYSPIRECRSPVPDQYSPVHQPAVPSCSTPLQQQLAQLQQQHQDDDQTQRLPAAPATSPHQQHHVQLGALPREVQMRVLCFLSADALSNLGCCNQQMRALCNEPVLWRRLFVHRWGKKVKQNNNLSWKVSAGCSGPEPRHSELCGA